jgi:TetR/AcrR family transcriptional regulator, transcriptional repressor of aconitase
MPDRRATTAPKKYWALRARHGARKILTGARWCFLNSGFAKTAFEDIAKRSNLSRTLLYRIFKDKEEIYRAVFADWLVSQHPAAKQAA